MFPIYKELPKLNIKKTNHPIKMSKIFEEFCHQRRYIANNSIKMSQPLLATRNTN